MKQAVVLGVLLALSRLASAAAQEPVWSGAELYEIASMSLAKLRPLLPDPSNRVADDPQAAELGQALFFDTRFSANGEVACASCHIPSRQFQDGLPVGHGIADASRRTMPLAGTAYMPFFFWDGRKDSQWSQALGPLENPAEHGADRTMIVQLIAENHRADYEDVFGAMPDLGGLPAHAMPSGSPEVIAAWQALTSEQQTNINRVFSNMGKAIAAFERTIVPPPTRFDDYAAALAAEDQVLAEQIFTEQERNGLKLFMGQAHCTDCHKGPQFTDMQFYNIGLPDMSAETDSGRSTSVFVLRQDPFNCLGEFSDAAGQPRTCLEIKRMRDNGSNLVGAFKSPSLRGVSQRPPYMHNGQFATMRDVLAHYNQIPKATLGSSILQLKLNLTEVQKVELEAFLQTLNVGETAPE